MQQYFFSFLSSKIQILLDIRCFCLLFFFSNKLIFWVVILLDFITMLILLICRGTFFFFFLLILLICWVVILFYWFFFFQQIFVGYTMICICSNLQILLLIGCLFIYIIALQNCVGYSFFFFFNFILLTSTHLFFTCSPTREAKTNRVF